METHLNQLHEGFKRSTNPKVHAVLDINIPNYASAIVAVDEVAGAISALQTARVNAR